MKTENNSVMGKLANEMINSLREQADKHRELSMKKREYAKKVSATKKAKRLSEKGEFSGREAKE